MRAAVAAGEIPRGEAPFGDLRPPQSLRARSDVKRETAAAVARGEIPRGEGDGYRGQQIVSVKSRLEVRAETREAMRLRLIPRGELNPVATEAQLEQVRLAGERALSMGRAVAARETPPRSRAASCFKRNRRAPGETRGSAWPRSSPGYLPHSCSAAAAAPDNA